jgi:hypothetical protein
MSIGKGVVGSADETMSRTKLEWDDGSACFIPQNGGKAMGWVHVKANTTNEESIKHAVIYSIKIPLHVLEKAKEDNTDTPEWVRNVISVCNKSLPTTNGDDKTTTQGSSTKLSEEDAKILKDTVGDLSREKY